MRLEATGVSSLCQKWWFDSSS